jgi:hypothetical protein
MIAMSQAIFAYLNSFAAKLAPLQRYSQPDVMNQRRNGLFHMLV